MVKNLLSQKHITTEEYQHEIRGKMKHTNIHKLSTTEFSDICAQIIPRTEGAAELIHITLEKIVSIFDEKKIKKEKQIRFEPDELYINTQNALIRTDLKTDEINRINLQGIVFWEKSEEKKEHNRKIPAIIAYKKNEADELTIFMQKEFIIDKK